MTTDNETTKDPETLANDLDRQIGRLIDQHPAAKSHVLVEMVLLRLVFSALYSFHGEDMGNVRRIVNAALDHFESGISSKGTTDC